MGAAMSAEHIIEEIHEFVGEDVRDSVIETRFGDRMVCLAAHPYFSMCAKESESAASTGMDTPTGRMFVPQVTQARHGMEGLCVSASANGVLQGCVLKG